MRLIEEKKNVCKNIISSPSNGQKSIKICCSVTRTFFSSCLNITWARDDIFANQFFSLTWFHQYATFYTCKVMQFANFFSLSQMAKKTEQCAAFSGKGLKLKFSSHKDLKYVCPPQVHSPYPKSKKAVLWDWDTLSSMCNQVLNFSLLE